MDNLTHSLAGVLLHGVASSRRGPPPSGSAYVSSRAAAITVPLGRALFWGILIASNIPDLDSLYAGISGDRKLGYLLHHRGHTHTLPFSLPVAMVSAALGLAIARLRPSALGRGDWLRLLGFSWLAALLHVAMDGWNIYGVHPFWPFDSRWYYGDLVFIVEPFLWFAWLPYAWMKAGRAGRRVWGFLGLLALGLAWGLPLPWGFALALTVWLALHAGLQRLKLSWATPVITGVGVIAAIGFSQAGAEIAVRDELARRFQGEQWRDVMVGPSPANPACWAVIALSTAKDEAGAEVMRIRRGTYASWPGSEAWSFCRTRIETGDGLVRLDPPSGGPGDPLFLDSGFSAPLAELRALAASDCRFAAFLQFARFPFWRRAGGASGGPWTAGDARFDRAGRRGDFSGISAGPDCPKALPPWVPPRADLLGGG